ncbi:MAG TPA: DegT/DnrJ/EryC1/StrS family aminotransferase [Planctomycetota bacterium]|nr:DegT/DnrJ/EryC1/StrS family aminotransferase [Planctomycetota bacterium]
MIPLFDCRRQCEPLRGELDAAISRVLDRGWFVLGECVGEFEEAWASYCGVRHCVGVGSGMDALVLSLKALGVGPGDEVVTAANVVYGALAARLCGADVVLTDVDENTGLMDLDALEGAISSRTKVILPTHLYGRRVDMGTLGRLARKHGCRVVEDACQAHGAALDGRRAGAWSDAGCFSFYPSKNLGALGDAGAVVTDDPQVADRLRMLRDYGQRTRGVHELAGANSRLDELQAAVLRVKLPHLDRWNAERRRIAGIYHARFARLRHVRPLDPEPGTRHVHHLFVVTCRRRDDLRAFLAGQGVATQVHYPLPVHFQPAFACLGKPAGSFPRAERLCVEGLSLPLFPELAAEEVERIARAVEAFDGAFRG